MEALFQLISNVKTLDEGTIFQQVFDQQKYRDFIVSRNTWGQLFEKGEDVYGKVLGYYKPATEAIKKGRKRDGTPFSAGQHFTLRDSGKFYESFVVRSYRGYLEIDADPLKADGTNLFQQFGENILGLTEQSKEELVEFINHEGDYVEIVKETILRIN